MEIELGLKLTFGKFHFFFGHCASICGSIFPELEQDLSNLPGKRDDCSGSVLTYISDDSRRIFCWYGIVNSMTRHFPEAKTTSADQ